MLKVQTGMTGISVAAEILCVLAAWASNDPTFTECWDLPVFVFGYPLPTKVQDKPWFQWGGKRKQPDPTQDICRCFSAPSTAKVRKHHLTSVQLRYKQCWWPSTVVSMCGIQFLLKLEVGSKIQEFSKTTFHHPMTLSHFKTWLYVLNTLYMGGVHDYFGCIQCTWPSEAHLNPVLPTACGRCHHRVGDGSNCNSQKTLPVFSMSTFHNKRF